MVKIKMMAEYAKHVRKPAKLVGLGACPPRKKLQTDALKLSVYFSSKIHASSVYCVDYFYVQYKQHR